MTRCPSDLALEAFLLDRERAPAAAHVAGCERCAGRLARMEAEGATFRREVFPETVDAIEEAAAPRPWWRARAWMVPVPAVILSVAAIMVLVNADRAPKEDYVGLKGGDPGALALTVFVGEASGGRAVGDGEEVPAAARLRFTVRPANPCRLWVASVDGAGQVSRLYPADGDRGAALAQGGALPGGAVLDGKAGPERIFAVCTPEPLEFGAVEQALAAAVRDRGGLQAVRAVPGMPDGTSQGSVLIQKRP